MLLKSAHAALAQTAGLVVKSQEAMWSAEQNQARMEEILEVVSEALKDGRDRELAGAIIVSLRSMAERWKNPGRRYGRGT